MTVSRGGIRCRPRPRALVAGALLACLWAAPGRAGVQVELKGLDGVLKSNALAALSIARAGDDVWEEVMDACVRAAGCFAQSRHVGADVMLTADFQRHAVLELNAFGDLLPGITHEGEDTYAAEARAMFAGGV